MSPEPDKPNSSNWLETFQQQYDLEKIPETHRESFQDFLLQRAAVRDYYRTMTEEQLNQPIGDGDSPKTELIHQIGHSRLRIEGLETGTIINWGYKENHKIEHENLSKMDGKTLITQLDETSIQLYTLFTKPETAEKTIQLPYGKKLTSSELLNKMIQHEALHAGILVKFGDYFHLPRPAAMIKAWG